MLINLNKLREKRQNRYLVEIALNDKLLGGQPLKKENIEGFVKTQLRRRAKEAKKLEIEPPDEKYERAIIQKHYGHIFPEEGAEMAIKEGQESRASVFFRDHKSIWLGCYAMEACLGDCISTLGITMAKRGSKQTMQHSISVKACDDEGNELIGADSDRLRFYRDDELLEKADGVLELTGTVSDAAGKRSIIKSCEYVEQATVKFVIKTNQLNSSRKGAVLTDDDIARLLICAEDNAVGSSRRLGFGKFRVINLERLTDVEAHAAK